MMDVDEAAVTMSTLEAPPSSSKKKRKLEDVVVVVDGHGGGEHVVVKQEDDKPLKKAKVSHLDKKKKRKKKPVGEVKEIDVADDDEVYNRQVSNDPAVLQLLQKHQTTHDFLRQLQLYITDRNDTRPITHTGMDLKKVSVDDEMMPAFIAFLARDVKKGRDNFICEILTDKAFRFFMDIDMRSATKWSDEQLLRLIAIIQAAVCKFFSPPVKLSMTVFMTDTFTSTECDPKYPDAQPVTAYKYGLHLVWPDVIVNLGMALYIAEMALYTVKRKLTLEGEPYDSPDHFVVEEADFPHTPWDQRIDMAVYRDMGGLRMAGSLKMEPCVDCKRKEKKLANCKTCDGVLGLAVKGRVYCLKWAVDKDGRVLKKQTKRLRNSWHEAMCYSTIRQPAGTPVRKDFCIPANAVIPEPLKDSKSDTKKKKKPTVAESHMGRLLRFENNRLCFKEYKKKEFLDKQKCREIYEGLQKTIRAFNPNYADICVQTIFGKKSQKGKKYLVIYVDGEGSSWCLNKGANHSSSNITFYVSSNFTIAQQCNSRKPAMRTGSSCPGLCSQYSSEAQPLDAELSDKIQKLFLSGQDGVSEEIDKQNYVKRYLRDLGIPDGQKPDPELLKMILISYDNTRSASGAAAEQSKVKKRRPMCSKDEKEEEKQQDAGVGGSTRVMTQIEKNMMPNDGDQTARKRKRKTKRITLDDTFCS